MRRLLRPAPERQAAWRPTARRTKYQVGSSYTEPYGSVFNASVRGMQGVAANNDASSDLSRARASVTGQTTIAASTATTSPPNGRDRIDNGISNNENPGHQAECRATRPSHMPAPTHPRNTVDRSWILGSLSAASRRAPAATWRSPGT